MNIELTSTDLTDKYVSWRLPIILDPVPIRPQEIYAEPQSWIYCVRCKCWVHDDLFGGYWWIETQKSRLVITGICQRCIDAHSETP